jgi:hypothetical protein
MSKIKFEKIDQNTAGASNTHWVSVYCETSREDGSNIGPPYAVRHSHDGSQLHFDLEETSPGHFRMEVNEVNFYVAGEKATDGDVDVATENIREALAVLEITNIEVPDRPIEFRIKRSR